MRGKIQLLSYVCRQLEDEMFRQDMPLTKEECETVVSCIQELEQHVLPHHEHDPQAA